VIPRVARLLAAVTLCGSGLARLHAQEIRVRDPGPGPVGRTLQEVLARPHRLVVGDTGRFLISRDSVYPSSVVAVGRSLVVEGRVEGDVIAVSGDIFVHPGAQVEGRAIAIGGAVYPSLLASVRGGWASHRDFTFELVRVGSGYALDYRELRGNASAPIAWPGVYGLRLPAYDRTNGLSLPFGPSIALDTSRIEIDALLTYRSQLGEIDPSLVGRLQSSRRIHAEAFVGRSTFSNDSWIWGALVNSASVIARGVDSRNYFRADRAQATVHWLSEGPAGSIEPFAGVRWERAWSTRPGLGATGGPWSAFGRDDAVEGILRPNPFVDEGSIASILLGTSATWHSQDVQLALRANIEGAPTAPDDRRFVQTTADLEVEFPAFRSHTYEFQAHVVATVGDMAPRQRWAYLGGLGTLPLIDQLSRGGDQLVYVENNYHIPIERVRLRFLGVPILTLRHTLGGADVRGFPDLEQNLALRLSVSFFRVQFDVDPASGRSQFGAGLSITR
jgi:hypothetical protein